MTESWQPDLESIPIDEALTFAIAWKAGNKIVAGKVTTAGKVTSAMRTACRATVERIQQLELKQYDPDTHLAREECMAVPGSLFAGSDSAPMKLLHGAAGLELVRADQLPSRPLYFYAVVVGDSPSNRVAFVRKTNPHKSIRRGGIVATLGNTLTRVENPVFILDPDFDLIVLGETILVLNQVAFELIFRDAAALVDRYPDWVKEIADHLPFDGDGVKLLVEAASRDSRVSRRLRAIHERGYFRDGKVKIEHVKKVAEKEGLDESKLIRDGKLVFDPSDRFVLLKLLNEDLFTGSLSGERVEVDRKSTRDR